MLIMQQRLQAVLGGKPVKRLPVRGAQGAKIRHRFQPDHGQQRPADLDYAHGLRNWRCFISRAGLPE